MTIAIPNFKTGKNILGRKMPDIVQLLILLEIGLDYPAFFLLMNEKFRKKKHLKTVFKKIHPR